MTLPYSIETLLDYWHRRPPFDNPSAEALWLDIRIMIYFKFKEKE